MIGTVPAFTVEFAVDGICELLEGFLSRRRGRLVAEPGFVLGIIPDDSALGWSVRVTSDARQVSRQEKDGLTEADCTLLGPASELYLELWNRGRPGGVRALGDQRPMRLWRELATISWS